jgi:hypothetical protein
MIIPFWTESVRLRGEVVPVETIVGTILRGYLVLKGGLSAV